MGPSDIDPPGAFDPTAADRQLQAILFVLVALGYVDGQFDPAERALVVDAIGGLVDGWLARSGASTQLDSELAEAMARYERASLIKVLESIDQSLARWTATEVAVEDAPEDFAQSRLLLRCFEVLADLDPERRAALMDLVDRLIQADGVVHPAEQRFREALVSGLARRPNPRPPEVDSPFSFAMGTPREMPPGPLRSQLLAEVEQPFPRQEKARLRAAEQDIQLMKRARLALDKLRKGGWGRLKGVRNVAALAGQAPFVDTLVHVFPPNPARRTDYIIVGDLHGCYGALKAILSQTDFFGRVERYRRDPNNAPDVKLVLVGDYIDRGFWSWEGVLRLVLRLLVEFPEHVVPLVGNHEWLLQHRGRIRSCVAPADAVERWTPFLPQAYFEAAKELFDSLGSIVLIDRVVVTHAGVPRQTVVGRWQDLSSLNDPAVRLEMCWSDPVMLAEVSEAMQASTQRFAFGMDQLAAFLDVLGARVLIRGHEKVPAGFRPDWDDGWYRMYTIFSAGGRDNHDLPEAVAYRQVQPRFLLLQEREGRYQATPVRVAWEAFNDPETNPFQGILSEGA